jgi:hypothetical protein
MEDMDTGRYGYWKIWILEDMDTGRYGYKNNSPNA